jgi:hypothetical protein
VGKTFQDNPEKCVVREKWDTPLLQYLHEEYGIRYRYLGLPGPELIDVLLWKDMIDEVIAFEPPDSDNGRTAFNELSFNLRKKGIKGIPYCGSLEEVVLLRKDFEGRAYNQDELVTLYNLDFCNEISSKVVTSDGDEKVWRFEAIRRVLQDQQNCGRNGASGRFFVLMITVRDQISSTSIRTYLRPSCLQDDSRSFYDACSSINPIPKERNVSLIGTHTWALKVLFHTMLCRYFGNPNFSALFFPQVSYAGTKVRNGNSGFISSPMLHWVVLCCFAKEAEPLSELVPGGFLKRPSVKVKCSHGMGALHWNSFEGESSSSLPKKPDIVTWLQDHGESFLEGLCQQSQRTKT